MRLRSRVLSGAAAVFFAMAWPAGAFTLVELPANHQKVRVAQGATMRLQVNLTQAAMGDGSVKLRPGAYNVEIFSMGDGSVRASFFDMTGRKAGEAHGIIAVLMPAGAAPTNSALVPAVQRGAAAPAPSAMPSEQVALNFSKLGFDMHRPATFSQQGRQLTLTIPSSDGGHSILIGLLPFIER